MADSEYANAARVFLDMAIKVQMKIFTSTLKEENIPYFIKGDPLPFAKNHKVKFIYYLKF